MKEKIKTFLIHWLGGVTEIELTEYTAQAYTNGYGGALSILLRYMESEQRHSCRRMVQKCLQPHSRNYRLRQW